jgi:N-acetylmuramoyl-L-alanine amidase
MFISIHVNAAKSSSAYGAETYTLGLAKTQSNLDVAMAENSVMLLEDDYKTKYRGFDPSSVDSYIMFEFMMDTYLDNSINFATDIQKQFTLRPKRFDRGVRQAGFWVLHRSACPSVLVELGFISNYAEEIFLASKSGQNELAESIYLAFAKYKKNHDKKLNYSAEDASVPAISQGSVPVDLMEEKAETSAVPEHKSEEMPVFKIQIKASPALLKNNHADFKGLKNVDHYKEGGMYKYTYGSETAYQKITQLKKDISKKFPDAFVVAFLGDKKISVPDALKYNK